MSKKGFTLVEVILSIAILGIISITFLGVLSNHFQMLTKTKEITSEVFLAQKEFEAEIDIIKEKIKNNELPLKERNLFTSSLGGVKVKYFEVEKEYKNKNIYTLISNIKPDPLEEVELKSIGIKLMQNGNQVSYGYGTSDFDIVGYFTNMQKYKWDHLLNQVEWYVSNKKYTMPMPKNSDFNLNDDITFNSSYFPLFPRDYELVENETIYKFGSSESNFKSLSEFAGRHIVFTVTPAAKSGKLGIQKISDSIFVSGLPITSNLVMHLDATYIDISDNNEIEKINDNYFLRKWFDLSSILGKSTLDEGALVASTDKPTVKRTDMDTDFIGQYVRFNNGQYLEITNQATAGKNLNIVSVVRSKSENELAKFMINGEQAITLENREELHEGNENSWIIQSDTFISTSNTFRIGDSNVDIAEIIIYNQALDEDTFNIIEKYLREKYKTTIVMKN